MCFAGAAWADTGGLRIAINDASGQPLAGATVKVSSPDSLVSRSGVTDSAGRVRLNGLDPATNYTVEVVASGYTDFTARNVAVVSGKELSVGYMLSGGTDAKAWSRLGIRCYGFAPLRLPPDLDFGAMFHGVDERVPADAVRFGVRVLRRFLDGT